MSVEQQIRELLMVGLEPLRLDVVNDSHQHRGHAGSPGTGESHFSVLVVSPRFAGQGRLARHRLVTDTLGTLLRDRIHALAIKAYAPGEPIN
jgi:BolA protein